MLQWATDVRAIVRDCSHNGELAQAGRILASVSKDRKQWCNLLDADEWATSRCALFRLLSDQVLRGICCAQRFCQAFLENAANDEMRFTPCVVYVALVQAFRAPPPPPDLAGVFKSVVAWLSRVQHNKQGLLDPALSAMFLISPKPSPLVQSRLAATPMDTDDIEIVLEKASLIGNSSTLSLLETIISRGATWCARRNFASRTVFAKQHSIDRVFSLCLSQDSGCETERVDFGRLARVSLLLVLVALQEQKTIDCDVVNVLIDAISTNQITIPTIKRLYPRQKVIARATADLFSKPVITYCLQVIAQWEETFSLKAWTNSPPLEKEKVDYEKQLLELLAQNKHGDVLRSLPACLLQFRQVLLGVNQEYILVEMENYISRENCSPRSIGAFCLACASIGCPPGAAVAHVDTQTRRLLGQSKYAVWRKHGIITTTTSRPHKRKIEASPPPLPTLTNHPVAIKYNKQACLKRDWENKYTRNTVLSNILLRSARDEMIVLLKLCQDDFQQWFILDNIWDLPLDALDLLDQQHTDLLKKVLVKRAHEKVSAPKLLFCQQAWCGGGGPITVLEDQPFTRKVMSTSKPAELFEQALIRMSNPGETHMLDDACVICRMVAKRYPIIGSLNIQLLMASLVCRDYSGPGLDQTTVLGDPMHMERVLAILECIDDVKSLLPKLCKIIDHVRGQRREAFSNVVCRIIDIVCKYEENISESRLQLVEKNFNIDKLALFRGGVMTTTEDGDESLQAYEVASRSRPACLQRITGALCDAVVNENNKTLALVLLLRWMYVASVKQVDSLIKFFIENIEYVLAIVERIVNFVPDETMDLFLKSVRACSPHVYSNLKRRSLRVQLYLNEIPTLSHFESSPR
mmetsp:Transcript_949/g.1905  ORF Transcript_949/g.1905 Transcript_949/m.1905 type:complete len:863 (-) Transcript_949:2229-4817(-)